MPGLNQFLAILYGFAARCLHSQISTARKNSEPIHHESAISLRPGQSLVSSPGHWYRDVFFVGKVLKELVLANLTCVPEPRLLHFA